LDSGAWPEARRYAQALGRYTQAEAIPWIDLVLERAHLLTQIGETGASDNAMQALRALLARCTELNALALTPRIEASLGGAA
jgi:hypothetical protein